MSSSSSAGNYDTDVVVIGAGPVGTALAIDLGMSGIRTVVLEARARLEPPHPGTNVTNVRSMEHFRHWGATQALRDANPVGSDVARDVVFAARGNGHLLINLMGALDFAEGI